MAADDPVETETPVFTEEEAYMLASFVAIRLGVDKPKKTLAAIEEAIPLVLQGSSYGS